MTAYVWTLKACFGIWYENWLVITAFDMFDAGKGRGDKNCSYFA